MVEFWAFLGTTLAAFFAFLGVVYSANKKAKTEQLALLAESEKKATESHKQFLNDTRKELSKLQDSYAESVVRVEGIIQNITEKQEHMQQLLEVKIDNLEKKQDRYNNVIERTFILEGKVEALEGRINDE